MAVPTLTQDEAAQRAALLAVQGYDIDLDLTTSPTTFASTTTVTFSVREPGTSTWIDLIAPEVVTATLNGEPVDLTGYTGQRLPLPALAAENTLVVVAQCAYSRTGEGLHRLVDPVDDEVYLYTQFEIADAQRVYACFDQPDLKAVFSLHVTAPDHWQVVSNSPTPAPTPVRESGRPLGLRHHAADVAPTSPHWSPGPTTWSATSTPDRTGTYPLGVFARASMAQYLDADRVLAETKAGLRLLRTGVRPPLPVRQVRPAVRPRVQRGRDGERRLRDDHGGLHLPLPGHRGRLRERAPTRSCTSWRTCGSATWSPCAGGTTCGSTSPSPSGPPTTRWWRPPEYTDAWTTFGNLRKTWAYRQDQLPSTHPIATDMVDLEAVKLNFDGITYAKGASALRQLVAWVGEEEFFAGLRAYFAKHKWGNTELRDLLAELEATSGRDLQAVDRAVAADRGGEPAAPAGQLRRRTAPTSR